MDEKTTFTEKDTRILMILTFLGGLFIGIGVMGML